MDSTGRRLYLDLVKRAVNQYLYLGNDESLAEYSPDSDRRYENFQWKVPRDCQPHSILPHAELDLLEKLLVRVHDDGVAGDFMEAGVWRGGAIVLMRAVVEAYAMDRMVIAADSFAGIPYSTGIKDDPVDKWTDRWAASIEEVRQTLWRYGLLNDRVSFISGDFKESLPSAAIPPLAVVRLDADAYESTKIALETLYPALSPGGAIIIDDWHLPGCFTAVAEYRIRESITSPLVEAGINVYWIKDV